MRYFEQPSSAMDETVDVLELSYQKNSDSYRWEKKRKAWARVEPDRKYKNLFSDVGIGGRGVIFTVRKSSQTDLFHAFLWNGRHCLLTEIAETDDRACCVVRAALCTPAVCRADADKTPAGCTFPGVLTEKYVGHEQLNPLAVVTRDYVLVTPKPIVLTPGSWVTCGGHYYRVLVPHELDEYKNEYEIRRKEDC